MATAVLLATATHSVTNVVNESDNITDLHTSVDDNPDTPTDIDWINNSNAPEGAGFGWGWGF